jgi:hypothetical protein
VAAGDVWVTVYDPKLDHSALRRFRANPAISPLPEVGPSGTWSDLTVVGTPTIPGGWVIAQRGAHFLIYRMT